MIKTILFLLSLFKSEASTLEARSNEIPTYFSGEMDLLYYENYANEPLKFYLSVNSKCQTSKKAFNIRQFQSEKKYLDVNSLKPVSVRIIHYYIFANNQHCKDYDLGPFEDKIIVPKSNKMTHIYITKEWDVKTYYQAKSGIQPAK